MPCSEDANTRISSPQRRKLLRYMGLSTLALMLPMPVAALARTMEIPVTSKKLLIARLATQTRIPVAEIESILADAQFVPSIIERITTPYESKPYAVYRPLFVTPGMDKSGREYLAEQRDVFTAVEAKYQVESEIIAAILGLETRFGRNKGNDRILDSLYTLASGYPRRSDFFLRELGEFLLLSREEHLDPEKVLGSYAGAFGATQFIPSSFRAYAVDEDGDGKRDVWNSVPDIIGSVANYFHRHGWEHGRPVAFWLHGGKNTYNGKIRARAEAGFNSWTPLAEIRHKLPKLPGIWQDDDKVALIEMQTEHGQRIALIHYNFYVITRWNRSYNYAMATTEVASMFGCKTCSVV